MLPGGTITIISSESPPSCTVSLLPLSLPPLSRFDRGLTAQTRVTRCLTLYVPEQWGKAINRVLKISPIAGKFPGVRALGNWQ